jgi:cold shock CspA family protein
MSADEEFFSMDKRHRSAAEEEMAAFQAGQTPESRPVELAGAADSCSTASPQPEFRASGIVKFFNPERGYGFIETPDCEGGEVFFHAKIMRRSGFVAIADGATIECMAEPTDEQKPRATSILSLDLGTATGVVRELNGPCPNEGTWVEVCVKRPTKGGLIFGTPQTGPDVLIPHSVIRNSPLPCSAFAEGQRVEVKYVEREKGRAAVATR